MPCDQWSVPFTPFILKRYVPPGLTSILMIMKVVSLGPPQCARCSGSVHILKTSSRGASKIRVMTSSSSLESAAAPWSRVIVHLRSPLCVWEVFGKPGHRLVPPTLMRLAVCDGVEHGLMQSHLRPTRLFFQRHRQNRFGADQIAIRFANGAAPHQPLRRHELPAHALPQDFSTVCGSHPEVIRTSRARIHFARRRAESAGPPPLDQVSRLRPRLEHKRSRRIEDPRDQEFRTLRRGCLLNRILIRLVHSSPSMEFRIDQLPYRNVPPRRFAAAASSRCRSLPGS